MKKIILTGSLLLLFAISNAQSIETLKKDFVKIENSKMILEDFTLIKNGETNLQMKAHCEGPENSFISRDKFIFYSSYIINIMMDEMIDGKMEYETLEEITGTPDIEINCFFGKTGIQIELKVDGKNSKEFMKWDEIL